MTIRLVFLGTSAAVPSPARNPSALALKVEGDVFLFDCAEGTQRQMMRNNVSYAKVKAILITHHHADHFLGIPGLVYTLSLNGRKEPLFVFGPRGTSALIDALLKVEGREFVQARDIDEHFVYRGEGFAIRAFPTSHSRGSLGFVFEENERRRFDKAKADAAGLKGRMFTDLEKKGELTVKGKRVRYEEVTYPVKGKKIVYTGDTLACEEVVEAARDADILIHDATFSSDMKEEALEKKHATARDAAAAARRAGVRRLILTHISNRYDDAKPLLDEAKAVFENTEVAFDGMEVLL
ncbi:MAG: ribonuclease Z [Candidatus Micrarchaeia archaeon]